MPYSVLTEPVISVLMPDGNEKSIGIKDAFINAHQIKDILGSNPLERYAVLRLLIAFAMDMLHPETGYDRADLLQQGRFDVNVLENYIMDCEKDGPRFDLFDDEHPFLQSRYIEELDKDKKKNIANICLSLPQGNNHVFIDHRFEGEHSLSVPDAFRSMCTFYLFCFPMGAKGYPSGVNNTPPLYAVPLGNNLFETIIYNTLAKSEVGNIPYGLDKVPWKGDNNIIPQKAYANISLIEAYTWMPRRITLILDDDQMIRTLYMQPGHDFRGNELWMDPHTPYRKNKNNTYSSIKPELGKLLWRDVASLTYDRSHKDFYQPGVLMHLINLFDEEDIPNFINIRITGLVMDNAKYVIWYDDMLSLPSILLNNEIKASLFRSEVEMIETMNYTIFRSIRDNVDNKENDGNQKKNVLKTKQEVAIQCQSYFLQSAHDLLFGNSMRDIIEGIPDRQQFEHFCGGLKGIVQDTLRSVLYSAGNDTDAMMRQIEAEKWIWISYQRLIKEKEEQYAGT